MLFSCTEFEEFPFVLRKFIGVSGFDHAFCISIIGNFDLQAANDKMKFWYVLAGQLKHALRSAYGHIMGNEHMKI